MTTTDTKVNGAVATAVVEMERAVLVALNSERDQTVQQTARERMTQLREENRLKFGTADCGVEWIREIRDSA